MNETPNNPVPANPAEQLAAWAVDCWVGAFQRRQLTPGTLGDSPVAHLLQAHHQLGRHRYYIGYLFTVAVGSQEQHEEAYTWWSVVYDHGRAAREKKTGARSLGVLLTGFPISVATLYEVDEAFDHAASTHSSKANETENLFSPNITIVRLHACLAVLCQRLGLSLEQSETLSQRLNQGVNLSS